MLFKWLSEEGEGLLQERIDVYRTSRRGRRGSPNPFQLGLAAIFAHVPGAIDAREREIDGLKLWYAAKHLILPGMMEPFIGQWTTEELRQKVKSGRFEKDLIPWIVMAHQTIARGQQFYQLPTEILDIVRQCDCDGTDLSDVLDSLADNPDFNPFDIDH